MKYIKLFMILAVALPFFTSCSEDDDVNSAQCTVGFGSTELVVDESAGIFNIPISVTGRRNGPIYVKLQAEGTGENPAVEGENFQIIDKTLKLGGDTLETGTLNVEVQILDDTEMNENRQFTLTIVDADGAEIDGNQITVQVMNNDGYYKSLFGEWTLTAEEYDVSGQTPVYIGTKTCDVTISGAEDESDPAYETTLTATVNNFFGDGTSFTQGWGYTFDSMQQSGLIGWTCDQSIVGTATDGAPLFFVFDPGDGSFYTGNFIGQWALGENGESATVVQFPYTLYAVTLVDGGYISLYNAYTNVTLQRK